MTAFGCLLVLLFSESNGSQRQLKASGWWRDRQLKAPKPETEDGTEDRRGETRRRGDRRVLKWQRSKGGQFYV
jgi:hypothetical protein